MFSACAEHAPDPSKVIAATKKVETSQAAVKTSQKAARDVHKQEREKIEEAQKNADVISKVSADILGKVDSLAKIIPAEFQPPLADIRVEVVDLKTKEGWLVIGLEEAWKDNDKVEVHLAETDTHLAETDKNLANLKTEQANYYKEAVKLADRATAAEKKLWWYRLRFWLGIVLFVSGLVGCIALALTKWGAKWAAKLGIAAGKAGL